MLEFTQAKALEDHNNKYILTKVNYFLFSLGYYFLVCITILNCNNTMDKISSKNGTQHQKVAILVIPFPAQGHLNQLLNLSCRLTDYKLSVHFAASSLHIRQAQHRLQGWNSKEMSSKIHFHDLQLPHFQSLAPKPDRSMQFPSHLQPLFDATSQLRQPVSELVKQISENHDKVVVVHDYFMASVVQDAKNIPNVEIYNFIAVSAFTTFFHYWENMPQKPFELGSNDIDPSIVPTNDGCFTPEFGDFLAKQEKFLGSENGYLCNTSRVIEGAYIDYLEKLSNNSDVKTFAIGPFHPLPEIEKTISIDNKQRHVCLQWLDKQEKKSPVIYVSFGSTTTMSNEQIKELAIGLEKSDQKFIWVLRRADKSDTFEREENCSMLPEGYEDRVKERGIVVKDWAPQLEILSHSSVGGFMSHCGWNSCLESMSVGVPIVAWPMHSDQPKNSILVTEVLKMGILIKDWDRRLDIVSSVTIENAIRKLMESKEGLEMRKNAEKLGEVVRGSVAEGGASRLEMDAFVTRISRIIG